MGLGREGQKPHLATIPWGPALGAPGSVFSVGPKGQAGPGCRIWQVGAGGAELPVGPQGKIWGGTEFPNSGRGPEGVGHSPQDLLSSYKQGNGVPRVQGLTVDTFVHVRACTHTHTQPILEV